MQVVMRRKHHRYLKVCVVCYNWLVEQKLLVADPPAPLVRLDWSDSSEDDAASTATVMECLLTFPCIVTISVTGC